jgi:cell division protein FtsB
VLFLLVNLLIAVQLSISISGHQRQITELAQESAELRRRVEVLEGALTPDPGNP